MRRNRLFKLLAQGVFLLFCYTCDGQGKFSYKAEIDKVSTSSFYKIILSPEVSAKCTETFSDIRIMNEKGSQVPYILQTGDNKFNENRFVELPIISTKKEADKQTHIVIENKPGKTISELLLIIKNTNAYRSVNITGSDDNQQWFIISEDVSVGNISPPAGDDRFIQSLNFPPSSYKYFKIIIIGKDLTPVNIVKAGIYQGSVHQGKYMVISAPYIVQKDSTNQASYVTAHFSDSFRINKLELETSGPKYFKRSFRVRNAVSPAGSGYSAEISSTNPASFLVDIQSKDLVFEISNGDSPPLIVTGIKAYQQSKYLLAFLEPGTKYQLTFGNLDSKAPSYDLTFFRDSINNKVKEVGFGKILTINISQQPSTSYGMDKTIILWVIIGSVLVLLLILTIRMTREINNRKGKQEG